MLGNNFDNIILSIRYLNLTMIGIISSNIQAIISELIRCTGSKTGMILGRGRSIIVYRIDGSSYCQITTGYLKGSNPITDKFHTAKVIAGAVCISKQCSIISFVANFHLNLEITKVH